MARSFDCGVRYPCLRNRGLCVEPTLSPHETQATRNPSDGGPSPENGPQRHRRRKKKERKEDGRIHVKVIIICKQQKGVSELAAAGIWIIRLQCKALDLPRGWHLQGGSERKKRKCDSSSVGMRSGCLSCKLLSLFLFQQLGFLL
jgi:hypothetical protein